MSAVPLEAVLIPENIIRDFLHSVSQAVTASFDLPNTYQALGLDLFIRNRDAAAALTVAFDGQAAMTVDAGAAYAIGNTRFSLITVTSAVLYYLQITGIKLNTLRRRGLM